MKVRYAKKTEKEIAIKFWKDSFKDSEEQIKFYFDNKKAMVCMDIEGDQQEIEKYYNKFLSLKSILAEFLPEILFEEHYYLENGKEIARIWVEKQGVCIYNKDTWQQAMVFLNEKMQQVECFWQEYEDFFMDDF